MISRSFKSQSSKISVPQCCLCQNLGFLPGKTWGVDGRFYVREKQRMQTSRDADLVSARVSGSPLAGGTCRKDKA